MDNSKSLVVAKKGIFQKIQEFLRKIFKKEKEVVAVVEENNLENKENFINNLKKNTNSDIKELMEKIQNGEVSLDEKNEVELSQIEEQLSQYLKYLDEEIKSQKAEISSLERAIAKAN